MADQRRKPLLRPRRALCARRRQCRRRGGAHRRRAAVRLRPRPRQERHRAGGCARRSQRADDEGRAAMATIPDVLPPEYAAELQKLQSEAPPMGWAFVKRRMSAELGPDWQKKFANFEHHPAAAASLGQVHRARAPRRRGAGLQAAISGHAVGGRGRPAAAQNGCSPSAAAWTRRSTPARSARRSARACARSSTTGARPSMSRFTARCSTAIDSVRVPRAWPELSTGRLLTLDWLEGSRMLAHKSDPLAARNGSPPPCSPPGGSPSAASA